MFIVILTLHKLRYWYSQFYWYYNFYVLISIWNQVCKSSALQKSYVVGNFMQQALHEFGFTRRGFTYYMATMSWMIIKDLLYVCINLSVALVNLRLILHCINTSLYNLSRPLGTLGPQQCELLWRRWSEGGRSLLWNIGGKPNGRKAPRFIPSLICVQENINYIFLSNLE